MTASCTPLNSPPSCITRRLLPFAAIVFLGYLTVGIPLAVLPVYLHDTLGCSATVIGSVMAIQSIATLLTRHLAGAMTDQKGAHHATLVGAVICTLSMLLYGASTLFQLVPLLSLLLLAIGRVALGLGESLLVTGVLAWSVATVGSQHAGRAMVWVGIAIFGAISAGAPLGALLLAHGFGYVALLSVSMPVVAALLALTQAPTPLVTGARLPFVNVMSKIWRQGTGLALSTMGFGAMFTFLGLYFGVKGWHGAPYGMTAFGIAYITARLFFGGLPDALGGRALARVTLPLQAIGLITIWLARAEDAAFIGCALLGAGYSLTFPALGVDAVRQVPAHSRGAAMGAYVAFVDIGLGITGVLTGALADQFGYPITFLLGAAASIAALALVVTPPRPTSR